MVPREKESSLTVSRFFKMLFGFDCLEVLYLPPEFAQRVNHLADQEIQIQDSCGERWSVTLSYVDGSLGFHKGWKKFCTEHSLKEGQLLEFSYTEGSHFSVRIYGLSACEKTNFNYDRPLQNKTSRRNPEKIPENEASATMNDASSRTKKNLRVRFQPCETHPELTNVSSGRTQLDTISTSIEDPICMNHRDNEYEGESTRFWFGLSMFEMENGQPQISKRSMKDLAGPEIAAILHPEITDYANKTWKPIDKSASYVHTVIAEQTDRRRYDTQMPTLHPDIVCESSGVRFSDDSVKDLGKKTSTSETEHMEQPITRRHDAGKDVFRTRETDCMDQPNTRRPYSRKAVAHNSDTHSMEQPNTKRDGTQKAALHTSDDNLRQPKTRMRGILKSVVRTSDAFRMERPQRKCNKNKAVICDYDTDNMDQPKTRRRRTKKGVACGFDIDGMEQSKTKRRHTQKGVACYSETDGMEQPKRKSCFTQRGCGLSHYELGKVLETKNAPHTETESTSKRNGNETFCIQNGKEPGRTFDPPVSMELADFPIDPTCCYFAQHYM